jgi:hypothetical protein
MQGDAGTVTAGCGCRSCLGNRAWLRRIEREVVADLRRQSARTMGVCSPGKRIRRASDGQPERTDRVDPSKAYFKNE